MTFKSYAVKIISREAKENASTVRNYWMPGVKNLGNFGHWEFAAVFEIESEFSNMDKQLCGFGGK
jgi:type III restriction enzyme